MTEAEFWTIINAARQNPEREGAGPEDHADRLTERLRALPIGEIVSFQGWFEYMINRADTGATGAAHTLITDGAESEDAFLYFRTWLVGQGEHFYKSVVADPDVLADRLRDDADPISQTDSELLRYAAGRACEARTGLRDGDDGWPLDYDVIDSFVEERLAERPGDRGQPIADAEIARRLPKLAARCEELWAKSPERPRNMVLERQPDGTIIVRYRQATGQPPK